MHSPAEVLGMAEARTRAARRALVAGALAVVAVVGVATPAVAATTRTVGSLAELTGELAAPPGPETVVLGADLLADPTTAARTADGSDLVLDLAGHDLALGSLVLGTGSALRITDSSATGGHLVVNGAAVDTPVRVPTGAALTIDGAARVSATGGRSSAVIGAHGAPDQYGAGAVSILGHAVVDVRGSSSGGRTSSGIGGPRGTVHVGDHAVVSVVATSAGAALGGGSGGLGGDSAVLIDGDAQVTATTLGAGAAIGSAAGIASARLTTVVIGGRATVVAKAGPYGPGIGNGGASATRTAVTIADDAVVTATGGTSAAGIGGGLGAAPGFSAGGNGADVTIGGNARVTAAGGSSADDAIGSGSGRAGASFGSLTTSGRLTVPPGAAIRVPAGTIVTNSGVLTVGGAIGGAGTLRSTGTVALVGAGVLDPATEVVGDRFALDLDAGAGTPAGPTALRLSTDTIAVGGVPAVLPTAPDGQVVLGWSTATDDRGVAVDDDTDLRTLAAPAATGAIGATGATGATRIVLHARFAARSAAVPQLPAADPPAATAGSAYRASLDAGGIGPCTYAVASGALPAGLSLDAETGLVSGTPGAAGGSGFTVTATNRFGSDSRTYRVEVVSVRADAAPSPSTSPAVIPPPPDPLPAGPTEAPPSAFPTPPAARGAERLRLGSRVDDAALPLPPAATYAVTEGTLPEGLRLDTGRAAVLGTPVQPGRYRFTIRASTATGTVDRRYALVVVAPIAVRTAGRAAVAGGTARVAVTGLLPHERYVVRIGAATVARGTAAGPRVVLRLRVPRATGRHVLRVSALEHLVSATRAVRVLRRGRALSAAVPTNVQANRALLIRVTGLAAGEPVRVRYAGRTVSPAGARADRDGRYRITVSAGWSWGWKAVVVTGIGGRSGTARTAVLPRRD